MHPDTQPSNLVHTARGEKHSGGADPGILPNQPRLGQARLDVTQRQPVWPRWLTPRRVAL